MGVETTSAGMGVTELFQLLRDGVPRTRAQLAKSTGLARSTIAVRVDELMRLGLVTPVAEAASTGGRPPSQFALNPGARVVVAADIGASHATVAITDLGAHDPRGAHRAVDITLGPVPVLTWTLETALALLSESGPFARDIAAIGIGVPGRSSSRPAARSIPRSCPAGTGSTYPGGWAASGRARAGRQRREHHGARRTRDRMARHRESMFVKIATGIGAGVISGGRLLPARRALRKTSATCASRAARTCRAAAATAAASRPWPRAPRSPASCAGRASMPPTATTSSTWSSKATSTRSRLCDRRAATSAKC